MIFRLQGFGNMKIKNLYDIYYMIEVILLEWGRQTCLLFLLIWTK